MAEWRDILDRAADNLSVDLNHRSQPSFRQQPAGWPAQRPGLGQAPFVASRDLLARELEAVSGLAPSQQRPQARLPQQRERALKAPATAHRASITQAIGKPAQAAAHVQPQVHVRPAAKKSGSGHELAALSISVGIVALAVYGFFVLLH
jgi:hypothetical protein